MLLIIVLVIALIAGVGAGAIYHARGRNAAPELEGDWWTEFEQQFRAYAARQSTSKRRLEK